MWQQNRPDSYCTKFGPLIFKIDLVVIFHGQEYAPSSKDNVTLTAGRKRAELPGHWRRASSRSSIIIDLFHWKCRLRPSCATSHAGLSRV